ncbi:MAG: gluconate 2-dehydrogenase subunit 3 family protein [Gammaproteobacteria bacterium]
MSRPDKTRRNLVLGLGAAAAAVTAAELAGIDRLVAIADDYKPGPSTAVAAGRILDATQLATLRAVCSQVIPATDTPGAAEADVHGFIDHQLYHCHSDDQQETVRQVLDTLAKRADATGGFSGLSHAHQLERLTALEASSKPFSDEDRNQFRFLKSMIVFGYFTSEIGATKALRFLPYPGGFSGSIPHAPNDKAWFK